MVITMKHSKLLFIIMSFLCLFGISACSGNNSNTANPNASYNYPEKSDFVFEVSHDSIDIKKGEAITIECSLKNISNENYYIEHGMEAITYTYNELSENIETIAVLEQFKSDSVINRTLNITADKAGKITITASIDVKPSEFSDQYKTYTFEKDVVVNIVD